jgi:hypothetical protein
MFLRVNLTPTTIFVSYVFSLMHWVENFRERMPLLETHFSSFGGVIIGERDLLKHGGDIGSEEKGGELEGEGGREIKGLPCGREGDICF